MDFPQTEYNLIKRYGGLSIVVLVHVLVVYALIAGLARKMVDVINQPIETKIIEKIRLPPPPPPDRPPPKMLAPPPPFIPPPEVQLQQSAQPNVIAERAVAPPEGPVLPMGKAEPMPVAAPVRIPAVVDASQCDKPEYPATSRRMEETGIVTLGFLIGADGRVNDSRVEKSSGSKALDQAAQAGLSLCRFKPATVDGKPEQSWMKMRYVWSLNR